MDKKHGTRLASYEKTYPKEIVLDWENRVKEWDRTKDKKRADKTLAESLPPPITKEVILEALERAKLEPAPASPELREPYFMDQISKGEKLSLLGKCALRASHTSSLTLP